MPRKTYRIRAPAGTDPETLTLTTYAVSFADPSTMVGRPVQNGVVGGFADYSITLDEPASPRSHYIIDTGESAVSSAVGMVSMSFISTAANISLSVSYPADSTAALPTWRVAGQADQVSANCSMSNPARNPVTIELLLPSNATGATLLAENAEIVHFLQSHIGTQLIDVKLAGNKLNEESVDRLLDWLASTATSVNAMDLTGTNMAAPSGDSCAAMDTLANRAVNLDHQPMLTPCPAYIQTTVNAAGVLVYNVAGLDWPVMDGTTLAINSAGELVATGDAADKLSINADGELLISAPLEELATA